MIRNERGFVYPLSLCFLIFFSLILLIAVEQNLTEKRFYKETKTILVGEYYLLSALKETEGQLRTDVLPQTGSFKYINGEVVYKRRVLSSVIIEVTLTLKLKTNEQWVVIAHYDKGLEKMVKWIEMN